MLSSIASAAAAKSAIPLDTAALAELENSLEGLFSEGALAGAEQPEREASAACGLDVITAQRSAQV